MRTTKVGKKRWLLFLDQTVDRRDREWPSSEDILRVGWLYWIAFTCSRAPFYMSVAHTSVSQCDRKITSTRVLCIYTRITHEGRDRICLGWVDSVVVQEVGNLIDFFFMNRLESLDGNLLRRWAGFSFWDDMIEGVNVVLSRCLFEDDNFIEIVYFPDK